MLLFGILLLAANCALGIVSFQQSNTAMQTLIEKDMLDIVNSAAASLDGDALGALTEDDVDGPVFNDTKRKLLVFQTSTDIEFIYAVKEDTKDHYVFTVDPDPVDPGAFGEEIVTTPALVKAADGVPSVDSSAAADRWGNFYSAYSPVRNSAGKVVGVVGVDFSTKWYDEHISNTSRSLIIISMLSLLVASVVVGLITNRVRVRFRELDKGLSELSGNVDVLMGEISSYSGLDTSGDTSGDTSEAKATDAPNNATDELESLGSKIRTMQSEMRLYLDYLRTQAYIDALTKVGSSTAYHEALDALNEEISQGTADFSVVICDINSLKQLNDTYGHECGDYYIQGAAQTLVQGFGVEQVFRIGGDEFAVITKGTDDATIEQSLRDVAASIDAFNASSEYAATLAVSCGTARFVPEADKSFKDVFSRADQAMYRDKQEYYRTHGSLDRRSKR